MAAHSGKNGTVKWGGSAEAHVTNWTLTTTSNNAAFASNDTSGWKTRVAGVRDSSGSFTMKDKPSFEEGYSAELILYTDARIYTVTVVIDSIGTACNMNDGTEVTWEVAFSGKGAVVITSGSAT
jgi:hypothetical protein